ncbi:SH3 domain-containing protein [Domibacillus sp. PGB-M46]|uniref:SH3 domain-containing protein n=1 Tax=Domibacillus sp. PGB-M46 TaxID=2910255 RepID=UPI001F59063E|nr:SH3 domain-containing protein [Domibacillus sp. PGB-M46]MCI2256519.1 SH3 domain-containing protein [Domibacillus sp. PGB-M46]
MKTFCKIILLLVVLLSATFQFQSTSSHAASSKVGYVSISSGVLNVRSGPGSKYKVIGSLKNNVSVSVYSQTKDGWSQIGYKKGKAYVSSQHLRMYSYLQDKTKVYTYEYEKKTFNTYYIGKYYRWDKWFYPDDEPHFLYEDSTGLYDTTPSADNSTAIAYPLKVGAKWKDWNHLPMSRIKAINGTLTTRAGTFKNVVTVKRDDGYITYFAPNVGLIKSVYDGETQMELVRLAKK